MTVLRPGRTHQQVAACPPMRPLVHSVLMPAAHATPSGAFGPAAGSFNVGQVNPNNIGASTITLSGSIVVYPDLNSPGDLSLASGSGTQSGTLNYSTTVGTTVTAGNSLFI